MADRTVSVALRLKIEGYTSKLREAQQKTKKFGDDFHAHAKKNKAAFDDMSTTLAGVGAAAAVGVGLAVKQFAAFDKAMSNVKAATHESAANMQLLRDAALDAGKRTAFSATQAAGAIENLAKAGVTTADILGGGLNGALDLAAAGELDVAQAAETAATAMTQFKLSGKDVPHIADLLAAAAGKAQGEVSDMAAALNQSGLVAAQMGLTIEETTGTLAAFASAGLLGSDAGTSFKTMLLRLANPAKEASDTMRELGIFAYDAQGAFVGVAPLAEQLQAKLGNLSQKQRDAALATIFGSDAIRAANVLYQNGAKGIADWTVKVNDAGFAAETAAIKQDNLAGDVEKLGGSIETALIKLGKGGDGIGRDLTRGITGAVDAFGDLPPAAQQATLAVGGLAAVGGLGAAGVLKAASAAGELRESWNNLGKTGRGLTLAMGAVGVALTAAVAIYGSFAKKNEEAKQKAENLRTTLDEQTGAITGNTRAYVANELAQSGLAQKAKDLGLSLSVVTDAALGNKDALASVVGALDAVVAANTVTIEQGRGAGRVINEQGQAAAALRNELLGTAGALNQAQTNQRLAAEGAKQHTSAQDIQREAIAKANEKIQAQKKSLDDVIEAMHRASGAALTLSGAQISYQEALASANEAQKANGRGLDITTEKGRANRTALNALAQAANEQTDAMLKSGRSHTEVAARSATSRAEFVKVATQMLGNKAKAEALAKSLIDIPAKKNTSVTTSGIPKAKQDVSSYVKDVQRQFAGIPDELVNLEIKYSSTGVNLTTPSSVGRRAAGGPIHGPGGPTDDKAGLFALSDEEWVIRAASSKKYGDRAMASVNDGTATIIPGFATGGRAGLKFAAPDPGSAGLAALSAAVEAQARAALAKAAASGGPAMSFARSQVGKPYVWGGVGPGGYDCSGFMSAITNVILGRSPHSRLFATGGFPTSMFAPGFGRFSIGSFRGNPGHMAGTLNGVNVESRGGAGVVVGPSARGAGNSLFDGVWHLKGYAQGGKIGDPAFDFLDPRGKAFNSELAEALARGPLVRDSGGPLPTGMNLVYNGTGRSEWITPMAGGGKVNHDAMIAMIAKSRGLLFQHEDNSAVFADGTRWDPERQRLEKASIDVMRRALAERKKELAQINSTAKWIGKLQTAYGKAADQVGKATQRIQDLVQQRNDFAASATSSFTGSLFGQGTAGDLKTRLDARANDARGFQRNLQKLAGLRKYVNPSLLKELAASSDYGAANELAQMSPAQLLAISKSYIASQQATKNLGGYVGNQFFGASISAAQAQQMHAKAVAEGFAKAIKANQFKLIDSRGRAFGVLVASGG